MEYLDDLLSMREPGQKLCLLPIDRVLVSEPKWLAPGMVVFPGESLDPKVLRVVSYPAYEFNKLIRRGESVSNGNVTISLEGEALCWGKSAVTGIDLVEFFGSVIIAFLVDMSWDGLVSPVGHESHLQLLSSAVAKAEGTMDIIRFEFCNIWQPQTLPGRVGVVPGSVFSAGLFYCPEGNESYIIAGQIETSKVITGIGLDIEDILPIKLLGSGEVASIVAHSLKLLSAALESATETGRFVQMLSIVEFLAAPYKYSKMQEAKKLIARQIAEDREEYNLILNDFLYLTSQKNSDGSDNQGLRHNIVHCGRRIEDLITAEERVEIFKRLTYYVCKTIEQLRHHGDEDWKFIESFRKEALIRLGL